MARPANGSVHPVKAKRADSQALKSISNTFRCRHLQAISLRNLVLTSVEEDHDEINTSTLLPTELSQIVSDEEALSSGDETRKDDLGLLSPSTFDTDLNGSSTPDSPMITASKTRQNGAAVPKASRPPPRQRPSAKRQISRSMSTAFTEARQRAYEDRILSRRVTTFFSLHRVTGVSTIEDGPIYVSEVQPTSMNPDFRAFSTGEIHDSCFLRSRRLVIRIWAKTVEDNAYSLLVEESIVLPELQFVSRDLDYVGGDFRDNTILYHLPDGVYASYLGPSFERRSEGARSKAPESRTASFDVLMKLKTLVDVIDDATDTQQKVATQIEAMLNNQSGQQVRAQNVTAQDSLQTIREAVSRIGRDVAKLKHESESKKRRLESRRAAFTKSKKNLALSKTFTTTLRDEAAMVRKQQDDLTRNVRSHSARVAEDLLTIFPIDPIPEDPLSFTICGCHCLHAKVYERSHPPPNDQEVSAALGFVATVVDSLSRTLLFHVPYSVHALGSSSTMRDDITAAAELEQSKLIPPGAGAEHDKTEGARTFPLYAKGADPARFRYAVYLLNRDIEELATKQGLRLVDVRDTLANVGFLLNSIAGTTRYLPKREAGRVAALRRDARSPG